MNKQSKRVLSYLSVYKDIDPLTSWTTIGVYRLASRIHDLIKAGFPIQKSWREVTSRYGEKIRVRVYYLEPVDKHEIRKKLKQMGENQ